MAKSRTKYSGPRDELAPELVDLAPGVWVTSGRAAIIEGSAELWLIDPGDEPMLGADGRSTGPLADLLAIIEQTGKPLGTVLMTHAHLDHCANLEVLRKFARSDDRVGGFTLAAHAKSPLGPDTRISAATQLPCGLIALPTPGHTHWGDDLSFWHPQSAILFSGDLVQPKGERWESTFYPSPYPYFTDGDTYLESLDALLALPFETLVTGHREIRFAPRARQWVEVTRRAIARVDEEVANYSASDDLLAAGAAIYRKLALERSIDEETIALRMAVDISGNSAFTRFDLTGIRYFWERRFGGGG
jgi:glyoxylase-like metal-dependent hydrolase (beta-lactamase superfamily II)